VALGSIHLTVAAALLSAAPALATPNEATVVATETKVRVEHLRVYSREIAGNLLGTTALREVTVVLPPGYDEHPHRLYPVVYALHGFGQTADTWLAQLHAPETIEAAFAVGIPEFILVFPSSENAFGGAFYANSPTTGNFENFIAEELVAFVDSHFRTLARRESRGLMGHSMGGYGTARLGMRHADTFGALYMMSPCCLEPLGTQGLTPRTVAQISAMTGPEDAVGGEFRIQGPLATAAAFSPNPARPPLYLDLAADRAGEPVPAIMAKRAANAPLAFIDQYISQLRRYRAIGMDVGNQDSIVPALTRMHAVLDSYGIANQFEVYEGTHTSRVASRFEDVVLPFFGRHLRQGGEGRSPPAGEKS
jgi:enterochelin esterase-like enzyme